MGFCGGVECFCEVLCVSTVVLCVSVVVLVYFCGTVACVSAVVLMCVSAVFIRCSFVCFPTRSSATRRCSGSNCLCVVPSALLGPLG